MIKYLRALFAATLLMSAHLASAQTANTLDQTLIGLQKLAAERPFEKAYLQLDKSYYGAGDTIWFKAYIMIGQQHRLSAISGVLNVDLINQKNEIIRSIKLPIANGVTRGDFALPDTLQEGSYRVRAYTNWMRNSGPEYFFDKTITIVNAVNNKVFTESHYTYALVNGQQTVNAIITYKDIEGKPYTGKDVKYEIDLEPQKIAKGKGTTDDKGNLHITFVNPSPGTLNSGRIVSSITIDNKNTADKTVLIKAATSKVDVQFFPESGYLVNGITSKVAFKAIGADGLGTDVKGTITDDQNTELTAFSSSHLGMGTFMLTPQTGKNYKAHITYPDGTQNNIDLPKVLDKGYVLNIDNADTLNNVLVQIAGAAGQNQTGSVTLVAQAGGQVYFEGKSKPGITNFAAAIPKSKFPSGVVQFTLFSDSGEPLNERLVFIQNSDKLKLTATSDQASYPTRGKTKISFNAKDKLNQPVQGNFSVAVINEAVAPVDENTENTILSNVLLTSDIKGYIEQPNYYFAHVTPKTAADLDVLMLTQGYSRFEWKAIINNTVPDIMYQPETALTISGTIKTHGGKPVPNGKVNLLNMAHGFFLVDTVTDKNGRFTFSMAFPDSNKFTIKSLNARGGDNVIIAIDKDPPVLKKNKNAADVVVSVDKGLEAYLQNSKKQFDYDVKYGIGDHSILLQEVNINHVRTAKSERHLAEEKAVEFSDNLNGKGEADQIITADDIEEFGGSGIWARLIGRMAGVEIKNDSNGALQPYSTRAQNQLNVNTPTPQPMQIVIDGMFDRDITLIPESSIESIEILRNMTLLSAYGSRGSNGVLVVTTKHGGQEHLIGTDGETPGLVTYTPKGYYRAKQFYLPKYDVLPPPKMPDLRSTIFWNPLILTDKDGNASFEFFNSDNKGTYRVVIEGIDYRGGGIGRQVYSYKVN